MQVARHRPVLKSKRVDGVVREYVAEAMNRGDSIIGGTIFFLAGFGPWHFISEFSYILLHSLTDSLYSAKMVGDIYVVSSMMALIHLSSCTTECQAATL